MKTKEIKKTPLSIKAQGHNFRRYLISNEYAEEMKCTKCGYVIGACYNEEEVKNAIIWISGKLVKCN